MHREVLIKHGLAEPVLEQLVQLLDQVDEAVALGNDGRTSALGDPQLGPQRPTIDHSRQQAT